MKKIGIVTDSHSGISQKLAEQMGIYVIPMPFYVQDKCYYEEVSLTREEFFKKLRAGVKVATSQPAPSEVTDIWDKALKEYETIVYIPMSSGLSGGCATAILLSQYEPYLGKVFVVDNGRVSTPQQCTVIDALELAQEGYSAQEIKEMLEKAKADLVIYVGVDTLENLKRGGRVSAASAMLGTVLNIKPILKFDIGTLDVYKKCRGFSKAKKEMIIALKNDIETRFKEKYDKDEIYILAASSASDEETEKWIKEIEEAFPGKKVLSGNLSMSLSCHIGYGGLGIGCSCKPDRLKK